MKQLKQPGFSRVVAEALKHTENDKLNKLDADDVSAFITIFFEQLAVCLKNGFRVVFPNIASFYTSPVKRNCYDRFNGDEKRKWWTYTYRVRFKPQKPFRDKAETSMTEAEYLEVTKKEAE